MATEMEVDDKVVDAKVVDIHTHLYPPTYINMLKARNTIPFVRTFPGAPEPRLVILEAEVPLVEAATQDASATLPGRPLTSSFFSFAEKLNFMDKHDIDISVISLPNPWLDFLDGDESSAAAKAINEDFESLCYGAPDRMFFFAALPLSAPPQIIVEHINSFKSLTHCRGIVLSTNGRGQGLDDPEMRPVFEAAAAIDLPIFLHPHHGLPNEVWGPRAAEYGHVLPLALGFPMETTIAVTRMLLAGVFDEIPRLRLILAHSGGTLPFLAGRIESCIAHDGHLVATHRSGSKSSRRTLWEIMQSQVYLDAVAYSPQALKAAVEASCEDHVLFGTDHPFFPPLEGNLDAPWASATLNAKAVESIGVSGQTQKDIMGGNAIKLLRLE